MGSSEQPPDKEAGVLREEGAVKIPTAEEDDAEHDNGKQKQNHQEDEEAAEFLPQDKLNTSFTDRPALLPQVLATGVMAVAQMDMGAIFAYPGVTLPQLLDETSEDLVLNIDQAALFGSVVYIGAMVGSFLAGVPMVRLGQRMTLLLSLPLSLASWITIALAPSPWLLLLTRTFQGLALSFVANSSSTYVVELAHSSFRGRLSAVLELSRQLGSLMIYVLGMSSLTWREVALTTGLLCTVLPFVGMIFLPNSPRWLATRGRKNDARLALSFFRGPKYDTDSELKVITEQLQKSPAKHAKVTQQLRQLRKPSILRYVVIMSLMLFLLHFNGMSVLPAYIVIIMNTAKVEMSSYLAAVAVGVTRVLGTLCIGLVMDRINRKPLFAATCLLCSSSMAVLGGFFFDQTHGGHMQHLEWLPLTCLTIYSFFSVSPVVSVLRSELFPTAVRSIVVPILYTTFFVGAFLSLQTYPYIVSELGPYGAFWLFSGCTLLLMMIMILTLPETRGKTLEQITEMQEATRTS